MPVATEHNAFEEKQTSKLTGTTVEKLAETVNGGVRHNHAAGNDCVLCCHNSVEDKSVLAMHPLGSLELQMEGQPWVRNPEFTEGEGLARLMARKFSEHEAEETLTSETWKEAFRHSATTVLNLICNVW